MYLMGDDDIATALNLKFKVSPQRDVFMSEVGLFAFYKQFNNLAACVCIFVCLGAFVCGGQRSPLGVIFPLAVPTLFF